ncbi:MAG: hypothetical protein ACRD20_13340 [Terriglobales bacterium]
MGRIRTIKPEFVQSESIGRLSREARLLFIQLWTISDDEGRARAASRMLASLLYPYDDDAPTLIDGWLLELETQDCILRYERDGNIYLQICKWLIHQKIDKPSKSRLPLFDEASRKLSKAREASTTDLVPRIVDLGPGIKDQNQTLPPTPLPKSEGGVEIWQRVLLKLKDDFAAGYVFNSHFTEDAYEKYFRGSHLIAVEDGIAVLDSSQPEALLEGLQKFHQRLASTFRNVAGYEVQFQLRHNEGIASPRAARGSASQRISAPIDVGA